MESSESQVKKQMVLAEMQRALDKAYEASDALDSKLQQLLGTTSLIAALAGTLQISALRQAGGPVFWIVLAAALAIYARIFWIAFKALRPTTKEFPMTGNWDVLWDKYFYPSEADTIVRIISDYIDAIKQASGLNDLKARRLQSLMKWTFALVLSLLIAMPISLAL